MSIETDCSERQVCDCCSLTKLSRARLPSTCRVRRRVNRGFNSGSSRGRLGLIMKSLGMTASRVEFGTLLLPLFPGEVVGCKVTGFGEALLRASKQVRRKNGNLGDFPIMRAIQFTSKEYVGWRASL